MTIEAVIFDMDGLLIDSEPYWRRAEQEIFRHVGLELTEAECHQTTGLRIDEVVDHWFGKSPWPTSDYLADRERIADAVVSRVEELVRELGEPMAGVGQTLEQVRDSGLAMALATSSARSLVAAVFAALDRSLPFRCADLFRVVCTATEEANGKPAPDVYLTTARSLEVPPQRCLALEDSAAGVESAKRAGMRVIAVPAPEARANPAFEAADRVLASLDDFRLEIR